MANKWEPDLASEYWPLGYPTAAQGGNQLLVEGAGRWRFRRLSGPTAARPADPYLGQRYFDTTISQLLIWDGAQWSQRSFV